MSSNINNTSPQIDNNIFTQDTHIPTIPNQDSISALKEELLSIINEKERQLLQKIETYSTSIDKSSESLINKTSQISSKYDEILASHVQLTTKLDRLNDYALFKGTTKEQLTSHEIRIDNIYNDLTKTIQKYDKIYIDNLLLPGYIGEYCKYKNVKMFFDDIIKQIDLINLFKEKQSTDWKQYKERLETIIQKFNITVESNNKLNMTYSKEMFDRAQTIFESQFKDVTDTLFDIRIENSRYANELKDKTKDLTKDWEKVLDIKNDIGKLYDQKVEEIKQISLSTVNSYEELKKEFYRIRRKFLELSEFIRDVRFRKNIGGDVKKKEIKEIIKKIDFKRKNSFDENDKHSHNIKLKKSGDLLNNGNPLKNNNKPNLTYSNFSNLRQSQSAESERKIFFNNKTKSSTVNKGKENNARLDIYSYDNINDTNDNLSEDEGDNEFEEHVKKAVNDNKVNVNHSNHCDNLDIDNLNKYDIDLNSNPHSNSNAEINNRYQNEGQKNEHSNINNNNNIITELDPELEQSGTYKFSNKKGPELNNLDDNKKNQRNTSSQDDFKNIPNTNLTSKSFSKNKKNNQNMNNNPTVTDRKKSSNCIAKQNSSTSSNLPPNSNGINVFDLRKDQKTLDKKIVQFEKKLVDLEIYTKTKLIELSKQVDSINTQNNGGTNFGPSYFTNAMFKEESNKNNTNTGLNNAKKGNEVSIIEIGGSRLGAVAPICKNNSNIIGGNLTGNNMCLVKPSSAMNAKKISTRIKTGNLSNRLDRMIMQTLGTQLKEEMTIINNINNNRNLVPEHKLLKKIEKKSAIDCNDSSKGVINTSMTNNNNNNNCTNANSNSILGSNNSNSVPSNHWVPIQSVLTNNSNRPMVNETNIVFNKDN